MEAMQTKTQVLRIQASMVKYQAESIGVSCLVTCLRSGAGCAEKQSLPRAGVEPRANEVPGVLILEFG